MSNQFTVGEYLTRDNRKAIVKYDMGVNPLTHDDNNKDFPPKPLVGWIENWQQPMFWGYDGKSYKQSNIDLVAKVSEYIVILTPSGGVFPFTVEQYKDKKAVNTLPVHEASVRVLFKSGEFVE